jgi:hypothetical protein
MTNILATGRHLGSSLILTHLKSVDPHRILYLWLRSLLNWMWYRHQ